MFIQKISGGHYMFPSLYGGSRVIGTNDSITNITDAFEYLFPSKASLNEYVVYYTFILFIGILFERLYVKAKFKDMYFNTFIVNLLVFFVFFSFFGSFYIHEEPWETLIYALVIPNVFFRKSRILEGKIVFLR